MSSHSRWIARAVASLLASVASLAAHAAPQYTVTALGLLPDGHFLDAYALNDLGVVTGYGFSQGSNMGFVWQNGQLTVLGMLPGAMASGGTDINNQGQIVGSSSGDAFIWQAGQMTALPRLPDATYASANAINDQGMVVGSSGNSATLWVNGQATALPNLTATSTAVATDINAHGTVVGISYADFVNGTPVTWADGQIHALGTGPYAGGGAIGVNNVDAAVGYVDLGGNLSQAARWDQGQLTVLNPLSGTIDARAYAINDAGDAVGMSSDLTTHSFATLWEGSEALSLQDLLVNGTGWQLLQALDINAGGQIVGWGVLNGQATSFLLSPVPEAATGHQWLLGLIALAALYSRNRKQHALHR